MTQTFLTNITVTWDADGTKGIFTVPTENGKKVLTMAEYINRERARFEAKRYFKNMAEIQEELDMLFCMLPAENVSPVRHGMWERTADGAALCTACKRKMNLSQYGYAFCCLCGAKMDLSDECKQEVER